MGLLESLDIIDWKYRIKFPFTKYKFLNKTCLNRYSALCFTDTSYNELFFVYIINYNQQMNKRHCKLIFAGYYTSGQRRMQPRAAESEFHVFQCKPDSCSEHLGLNNDLLRNTIGIQIGKYF